MIAFLCKRYYDFITILKGCQIYFFQPVYTPAPLTTKRLRCIKSQVGLLHPQYALSSTNALIHGILGYLKDNGYAWFRQWPTFPMKDGKEAWLKVSRDLGLFAKMQVREAVNLVPVGCEFTF